MWKYVLPPVFVVATLWVLMSSGTTFYLRWIEQSYQRVLDENVAAIQVANDFQRALRRLDRELSAADAPAVQSPLLETHLASLSASLSTLSTLSREERGTSKLRELAILLQRLKDMLSSPPSASTMAGEPVHDAAPAESTAPAKETIERLGKLNSEIIGINQHLIDQAAQHRMRVARFIHILRITLLCTGPVVGVWLGWQLSSRLQRSVGRIAVILRQMNGSEIDLGRVTLQADGLLGDVEQQAEAIVERLRTAHRELDNARNEVVRSERLAAVGQLAAGVAHEIRNPLTSVKLLLQHAARQPSPAHLSDGKLRLILDEIARIESIVQGLLDFSRVRPLRPAQHDVTETIRRALRLVEGRASQQNVSLQLRLIDGAMIDGDAEQLQQVFVNLLINAIEAMPGGGRIVVEMSRTPAGVCIAFHDSGAGIPETMLPRLFEPFATSKERGTGLGLAVSRRIIDEHGGSLVGANDPAGGATFIVEVPARSAISASDGCEARQREAPARQLSAAPTELEDVGGSDHGIVTGRR